MPFINIDKRRKPKIQSNPSSLITTVPAILSCQPCFFLSKATQINPKKNTNIAGIYAIYRMNAWPIDNLEPVSASTILSLATSLPGVAPKVVHNHIVATNGTMYPKKTSQKPKIPSKVQAYPGYTTRLDTSQARRAAKLTIVP